MIDVEFLRKYPEKYKEMLKKRFMDTSIVDEFLAYDNLWRSLKKELDNLRCLHNAISKAIATGKLEHNCNTKIELKDDKEYLITLAKSLKKEIEILEKQLKEIESKRNDILWRMPNYIREDVPIGEDERYNKPLKYWGVAKVLDVEKFKQETQRKPINILELDPRYIKDSLTYKELIDFLRSTNPEYFVNPDEAIDFDLLNKEGLVLYIKIDKAKHHYDLTKELNIADQELGSKIAGSRFYVEFEKGLFMELKLIKFVLETLKSRTEGKYNYKIMKLPYLVRGWVEKAAAYFTAFEDTLYKIEGEDLYLNPTAEHPIAGLYKDYYFNDNELPLIVYGFTTAFRKEAGSHGKDTKGIFRVHQFEKIEQYAFTTKEQLLEIYNFLVSNAETIVKKLGLPYRIVFNSSGDMDKKVTMQWDLEVYYPAQEKYRELHSFGTVEEWQARRLNIKYSKGYVNTIYATALPIQRAMTALLENNLFELNYNRLK